MAGTRKYFRIFLASPGDLMDERRIAKRVVDEYNSQLAGALGYYADLVGWEDTLPGIGRPQALINRDLDGCDLFVGMLWKRWGTQPDIQGEFTSGFEEEFERSLRRSESEKRPQIHLLLKDIDQASLVDPGEQLKRVQEFRTRVFAERKLLAKTFAATTDFEQTLRQCIQGFAIELQALDNLASTEKTPASQINSTPAVIADEVETETALPVEGIQFLRNLMNNLRRGKDFALSPPEIARFRLLSITAGAQGNDETILGAHDANLLFRDRNSLQLSNTEKAGLLDAGLSNLKSQNSPIWHWLASLSGFKDPILPITSVIGSSTARRVGAIYAMRQVFQPLVDHNSLKRTRILNLWFSDENEKEIKQAALAYLAECGTKQDVPRIRAELSKNDSQIEISAITAILTITEREEAESLFSILLELRPASVNSRLLAAIFSKSKPTNEQLIHALDQHCQEVRQKAIEELRKRRALPIPAIEKLLLDDSADVRHAAMMALSTTGRTFSSDEAKSILIKRPGGAKGTLAFANLTGLDSQGEELYAAFCRDQLLTLQEVDLVAKSERDNFEQDAFIALAKKYPNKYSEMLANALNDLFLARHQAATKRISEMFGGQSEMVGKMDNLSIHLRKKYARQALDLVTSQQKHEHLALVRNAMRSGFIDYSPNDIIYLGKNGSHEDIPLIISSLERPNGRSTLLGRYNDNRYTVAAEAIKKIAKSDASGLFQTTMPSQLKAALIAIISPSTIKSLSTEEIDGLLQADEANIRKATALKLTLALSKRQLTAVLLRHIENSPHYYNVVHWLDFGISVPQKDVIKSAKLELDRLE